MDNGFVICKIVRSCIHVHIHDIYIYIYMIIIYDCKIPEKLGRFPLVLFLFSRMTKAMASGGHDSRNLVIDGWVVMGPTKPMREIHGEKPWGHDLPMVGVPRLSVTKKHVSSKSHRRNRHL